jgi:hypothetical protein
MSVRMSKILWSKSKQYHQTKIASQGYFPYNDGPVLQKTFFKSREMGFEDQKLAETMGFWIERLLNGFSTPS